MTPTDALILKIRLAACDVSDSAHLCYWTHSEDPFHMQELDLHIDKLQELLKEYETHDM